MPTTRSHRPRPEQRRLRSVVLAAVAALAPLLVVGPIPAATEAPAAPARVTVIGDSVMASLDDVPAARRAVGRGLELRSDSAVCRRLVAASCSFQGSTPKSALEVVQAHGRALGRTVVLNVGYNDWAAVYDVDRVLRALRGAGVERVVWVTLREASANADVYRLSNARIRAAERRWKGLVVADWNARSRGRAWFRPDGLHLTPAGALALARLVRPLLPAAPAAKSGAASPDVSSGTSVP